MDLYPPVYRRRTLPPPPARARARARACVRVYVTRTPGHAVGKLRGKEGTRDTAVTPNARVPAVTLSRAQGSGLGIILRYAINQIHSRHPVSER